MYCLNGGKRTLVKVKLPIWSIKNPEIHPELKEEYLSGKEKVKILNGEVGMMRDA